MRLTAHDLSFDSLPTEKVLCWTSRSADSDFTLRLNTLRLDPSQQVGAGKTQITFKLRFKGDHVVKPLSNGQCYPSVVLDIDGKSELALGSS